MELFFIVNALKRGKVKMVTAVIPYLGYQRQDHVFRNGEAVSLEVIIKMLEAVGVDKVVTFDLHSIKIPELFHIPVVHLSALHLFAEKISETLSSQGSSHPLNDSSKPSGNTHSVIEKELTSTAEGRSSHGYKETVKSSFRGESRPFLVSPRFSNSVLVSPDMGGIRRIKILSQMLGNMPYATIQKNRDLKSGKIEARRIHGSVKRHAIIVDDMISTGNTIVVAADLLNKRGAEEIIVFATHPVFSKDAPKLLQKSKVKKVFVTDTIEIPKDKLFPKLEVLSVAEVIVSAIKNSKSQAPNFK